MEFAELLQTIFNTILIPAILGGGGYLVALIGRFLKKWTESVEIKRELESLAKRTEIKNTILTEVQTIVESVVGSNMQIADSMKKANGGQLTDDQSAEIKKTVESVIMASLPPSLTEENGVLLNVVGGSERLKIIVGNMIDRSVYDYKIKKSAIK